MRETWALFNLVYVQSGWQRFLPSSAIAILSYLATQGAASSAAIDEELKDDVHTADGLTSEVWEPPLEYTDEELRQLDENSEGIPLQRESSRRSAEVVNAEALATRTRQIAEFADFSSHLGLAATETLADLLDFMAAARVIVLANGKYSINPVAPLPEEVLPLSESRRETEAQLRWGQLHQEMSQRIIALFKPEQPYSINSMSTTIDELAQSLQADPQSIREALAVLVDEGDFTITSNPLRASADELFTIDVDWEAFYASRMSVRFSDPPNEDA
ncbi:MULTISPECIES: DUF6042 family protein [Cryobacterium]|uniref:DUF6042 family protein n=1 Tax=Cryobacterium TaxID=69578 RepID=UPI000CD4483A|nr:MULTISPECIES: DUF6042 family protein [Cryobacterium]POH67797.1 hypothetical protein C3B60_06155 [Cryobacterium zongtaii]TFC47799.1 hypothetical protein E3O57_02355 [Cryobacterium sp. TMN-39-2]